MVNIFYYEWLSLEMMSIAFIALFLENTKLFYVLLFFNICIEILADSNLCKYLKAIKCSESRVSTLQIFYTVFLNAMRDEIFTVER